jgi:hypothetical protein
MRQASCALSLHENTHLGGFCGWSLYLPKGQKRVAYFPVSVCVAGAPSTNRRGATRPPSGSHLRARRVIPKGSVAWVRAGAKYGHRMYWNDFDILMQEKGQCEK